MSEYGFNKAFSDLRFAVHDLVNAIADRIGIHWALRRLTVFLERFSK